MPRMLLVAAALVVVLAGCGEDSPAAEPSPSSPSTSPVSTTPAPPELPAAARENTKAGAIAFVRHYVELINYAQATGDVDVLTAVEDPGCQSCVGVRDAITEIYSAGGSIQGGTWHPHPKVALKNRDGSWLVTGTIRFDSEKVRRTRGGSFTSTDGGSAITHMTVGMSGGAWRVHKWSRES